LRLGWSSAAGNHMARLIKDNRMPDDTIRIPTAELSAKNKAHFPNEISEYRQAKHFCV
jgi:hypothetical protein